MVSVFLPRLSNIAKASSTSATVASSGSHASSSPLCSSTGGRRGAVVEVGPAGKEGLEEDGGALPLPEENDM